MKQKPLISVIVPVKNTAVLLHHNIDTLTSQTYNNLEIILVDDESSDSSGRICDESEDSSSTNIISKLY